jgi:hypothetical protein
MCTTMQTSHATDSLLATLVTFSHNRLTRRSELGTLLELAALHNQRAVLDDLSFVAKFVSRVYGIMRRIGKGAEGYDILSKEFSPNLEKGVALIQTLLRKAPIDVQQQFATQYLSMTHESLQNLLALFYDLSWYKNWLIDHAKNSPSHVF